MAETTTVRLGYFSPSVVCATGQRLGLFAGHGLRLTEELVPSSPAQFRSLRDGDYDAVLTSPDNVMAYRLNSSNPLGGRLELTTLLAVDHGLGLSLLAAPEVREISQLRGARIGVDAASTGFAYALYTLLRAAGLERERDYEVVALGSTPRRREALLAGECQASMLNAGSDVLAEQGGCHRLVRVTDALGPYLGTVLATTTAWATGQADTARRLGAAWGAATAAVLDPAQRDEVTATLGAMFGCSPATAAQAYATLVSPEEGLVSDGRVDPAGLATVVELRQQWGGFDDPQAGPIAALTLS